MVVVAIIAVLVALFLPVINKARYQARLTACASNLRQIAAASIAYANDSEGYWPAATPMNQFPGRVRVMDAPPVGLARYCGGSVSYKKNKMWLCEEAESRISLYGPGAYPGTFYSLYYNTISGVYSGIIVTPAPLYGMPVRPTEAMRRMGTPRIFKQAQTSGELVKGWQSRIIASDISLEATGGVVEAGHMRGDGMMAGGYSPLRSRSAKALATANFAFEDGSVRSASYTGQTYRKTMTTSNATFDWDGYLLPRNEVLPYP